MLDLLQKLKMISGGKIVAALCAVALAAPAANPAAAYDQICFKQRAAYTTNGVYLRKAGESNPEDSAWSHHLRASILWGGRKCMDVRGRMKPGDIFNMVQDIKAGPDKRCSADGGRGDGMLRWPAGGGTLELEGHGTVGHGRCLIVQHRMWDGCADNFRGGFSQFGCQDWQPEAHRHAAYDIVLRKQGVAYLRSVLERGADPNAGRYGNETPLHAAIRHWLKEHIDALLIANADPLRRDHRGKSALWTLLDLHGHRSDALFMFQRMLYARVSADKGRNARMINEGLRAGGVPAMIHVVRTKNPDLVEFALRQGGDASETTHSRYSALHHAAKVSLRMVRLLLERGADPNVSTRDGYGTPLHWAVHPRFAGEPLVDGNRGDMAAVLVKAGGDPNMPNRSGQTPLHFAAQLGDALAVGSMLERDGDPNYADNDGLTALHYAAAAGHSRVMEQLINSGADPSLEDHNGNTAAELASR